MRRSWLWFAANVACGALMVLVASTTDLGAGVVAVCSAIAVLDGFSAGLWFARAVDER